MTKIHCVILDCTSTIYNAITASSQPLGGIERTIIALSKILSSSPGWTVTVCNKTPEPTTCDNVTWTNMDKIGGNFPAAQMVIACNDPNLFDQYKKKTGQGDFLPVLWLHNLLPFEKALRKGRFFPLLRWKPVGVFLSIYHNNITSRFLPFGKRVVIPHGIEDSVLDFPVPDEIQNEKTACFISQAYRGLAQVIRMWKSVIFAEISDARLEVYCANPSADDLDNTSVEELKKKNVNIMGRKSRNELNESLSKVRVLLIPGHKDETYCLSATESIALGVPVVTMGVGALAERVEDGRTGFIATSEEDFAEKTKQLLTDDALWRDMHQTCLKTRESCRWKARKDQWTKLLEDHGKY
ncbi:MAG TPA: glycosyltransferase [Alphaproteobacteria bacterium]|nr:glycosyltransferase [Alphaproteobacteria bacterium]HNS44812.1 glycosyltransferase [Alphaproteobacteria bacterium]